MTQSRDTLRTYEILGVTPAPGDMVDASTLPGFERLTLEQQAYRLATVVFWSGEQGGAARVGGLADHGVDLHFGNNDLGSVKVVIEAAELMDRHNFGVE